MRGLFQASSDGTLAPRQLRLAWLAGGAASAGFAIALVGGGLKAVSINWQHHPVEEVRQETGNPARPNQDAQPQTKATSEVTTAFATRIPAAAPRDVRVLGVAAPAGKGCDEQTWPYIETRCLSVSSDSSPGRITARHGSDAKVLPAPPKAQAVANLSSREGTGAQVDGSSAATTGSGPSTETVSGIPNPDAEIPLPPSRPDHLGSEPRGDVASLAEPAARASAGNAGVAGGQDGNRRERAAQRRAAEQMERAARAERLAAAAEARRERRAERVNRGRNGDRIVRRWTEYTFATPSGGSRRVIVIRRGSLNDDFFRTIR